MAKATKTTKEWLRVGGVPFEVRRSENIKDEQGNLLQGDTDVNTRIIRIDSSFSTDRQAQTLFHEAIHVALYISGQQELLTEAQEEGIVLALEHMLWPVLPVIVNGGHDDNPRTSRRG